MDFTKTSLNVRQAKEVVGHMVIRADRDRKKLSHQTGNHRAIHLALSNNSFLN